MVVSVWATNLTIHGGSIAYSVSYGAPPFSITLNGSSVTSDLPTGTYEWLVTDSLGCSETGEIFVPSNSTCGDEQCDTREDCWNCARDCGLCVPAAPAHESLRAFANSSNTIVLTWAAPPTILNGSLPFVWNLQIKNSTAENFSSIYKGNLTRFVVMDLANNTVYYFRVAAGLPYANVTWGNFSPVSNFSTTGPPAAPQLKLKEHGRDFLLVIWDPTFDGGLPVSYYSVSLSNTTEGPWEKVTIAPNQTLSAMYTKLQPNETFYFKTETQNVFFKSVVVSTSFATDPAMCGDQVCDPNETCSSCFYDCGACSYPPCQGNPECSGNGECVQGICVCTGVWYGPSCSNNGTVPIQVTANSSTAVITDPATLISFSVVLLQISEVDIYGNTMKSYNLSDFASSAIEESVIYSNSVALQKRVNISLPNGAFLEVSLIEFSSATNYSFANLTVPIPEHGIKYLIYIQNWPFMNIRNKLQVRMQTDGFSKNPSSACGPDSENSFDGSTNLLWFKLNIDGISLYATFVQATEVDKKYGKVSFSLLDNYIVISVPSFWEYAIIDPIYSVLVDVQSKGSNNDCDFGKIHVKKGVSEKIVGGVVGGVVGTAIVLAISIFLVKMWHRKQWRKKFKQMYS
eukprot:Phypoly_transcript_05375.p1 GENE.Phypoly_transcript_05375~~Phypoly_transcript_05375.p1  ORF type:complete len:628 (+),score=68.17 Phypoly_transcript_05375:31-1914(+)